MKHLARLPFSGFYGTIHDSELDHTLEQMFSDRDTGNDVNHGLLAYAFDSMNWRKAHADYCKEYTEDFAIAFKLDLEFESMTSPREYNFETDKCWAYITESSLLEAFKRTPRAALEAAARSLFTSYDGFISFYSPNIDDWPESPTEWDYNQIMALLLALVTDEVGEWSQWQEYELMEGDRGNGVLDDILYRSCPQMERLLEIHEYLQARAKREEVAA